MDYLTIGGSALAVPAPQPFRPLGSNEEEKLLRRAPLEHALRVAGIRVFVTESAEAYKAGRLDLLHKPLDEKEQPRHDAKWMVTPLGKFLGRGQPVPKEAITIVREIKARFHKAQFEVHHLFKDPFLRVWYKDPETGIEEKFYVYYWNEPGFAQDN
jgi:hypothetical protein